MSIADVELSDTFDEEDLTFDLDEDLVNEQLEHFQQVLEQIEKTRTNNNSNNIIRTYQSKSSYDLQVTRTDKYFDYTWINYESDTTDDDNLVENQNRSDEVAVVPISKLSEFITNNKSQRFFDFKMKSTKLKNRTKFLCLMENCRRYFYSQINCMLHIFYHDLNTQNKPMRCFIESCSTQSKYIYDLNKHFRRDHCNEDIYKLLEDKITNKLNDPIVHDFGIISTLDEQNDDSLNYLEVYDAVQVKKNDYNEYDLIIYEPVDPNLSDVYDNLPTTSLARAIENTVNGKQHNSNPIDNMIDEVVASVIENNFDLDSILSLDERTDKDSNHPMDLRPRRKRRLSPVITVNIEKNVSDSFVEQDQQQSNISPDTTTIEQARGNLSPVTHLKTSVEDDYDDLPLDLRCKHNRKQQHKSLRSRKIPVLGDRELPLDLRSQHDVTNTFKQIFKCTKNLTVPSSKKTFEHHNKLLHESKFNCPNCNEVFLTAAGRQCHMTLKHKHGLHKPIACPFKNCLSRFSSRQYLRLHQQNVHKKRYACTYTPCQKKYMKIESLQHHMEQHRNGSYKERKCEYDGCCKIFSSTMRLKNHLIRDH